MAQPRISVYMPAYEPKSAHIRAAVESVLAQTSPDWTLLINDDASTRENTEAYIHDYLSDPRITFRRNSKNLGIGGNWNACWREVSPPGLLERPETPSVQETSPPLPGGVSRMGEGVRGVRQNSEFVAFLFHDDLWEPTYLEKMLAALDRNPSAGFAAANHVYVKEGEVSTAPFYDQLHDFVQKNIAPGLHEHHIFLRWWLERGLRPNVIGEPSFVVLRRTLMDEVGPFNESMVQFLDSEYWARCLLKADWVYVPEILGKFRVHPAGMSAVNEQRGRGVFERFETLRHVITALPPEDRRTGNDVLVKALSTMIGRFLHRLGAQQSVSGQGSRSVGSFLLRHPLLTLRAGAHWALHHPRTDESFT